MSDERLKQQQVSPGVVWTDDLTMLSEPCLVVLYGIRNHSLRNKYCAFIRLFSQDCD